VIPDLIEQYVDSGQVRYVYREFPLDQLHPAATPASEAAVCAGQQDKYWEMNDKLFASVSEWSNATDPTDNFKAYAEEIGLDPEAFQLCLDSGDAQLVIQGDRLAAEAYGVNATPYFFVNDLPVRGGLPIETLGQVIEYVAAGGPRPEILPAGNDWHVRGDLNTARAVTVAFVDFANTESGDHAREVFPRLMESYVDSGQMLYVLHPWSQGSGSLSEQAAVAAECAGEQGNYWDMHQLLFENQADWIEASDPADLFAGYGESLDLDSGEFESCVDSDEAKLRVQAGNVVGALYGVPTAPIFLFNNGQGQQGSPTFEEFETVISSILGN
jgi:protein-disulfide isomerase